MPASNIFQRFAQGQAQAQDLASAQQNKQFQRENQDFQRGQQFLQLDDQRKKALFTDAREINTRLGAGDVNGALGVLSERVGIIEQLGGDTTDTREIADLLARGDLQGAQELLSLTEDVGMKTTDSQGNPFLQDLTPAAQQFKNVEALATGDRIGISGGVEQVIPASLEVKQARRDALKLKNESTSFLKQEQKLKLLTEKAKLAKEESSKAKIDQEVSKRKSDLLKKQRGVKFEFDSAISNIDDSATTIDRMLEGSNLEAATGFQANFPTVAGSGASDFEALLDTLQSQAFLSQVEKMKGLGALSENEGKKLSQALGSLTIRQSDESLRKELKRIKGKFAEAKKRLTTKFGGKFASQPVVTEQSDQDLMNALGL